ncbi:MAG TPA: DUF5131 family protein, partial [Fontimonas sp.]
MTLSGGGLPDGYNFVVLDDGPKNPTDELSGLVALAGGELLWNVAFGNSGGSPARRDYVTKPYLERWARSTGQFVDEDTWRHVIAYEYALTHEPARWPQAAQRILVAPAGDLFSDRILDGFIDRVFDVIAQHPQHTFFVVTQRAERMKTFLSARASRPAAQTQGGPSPRRYDWPLNNVCIGVLCEDQKTYMTRVRPLLETPAAMRFVVFDPLVGPVRMEQVPLATRDILWPLKGIVQAYQGQDADGKMHWEPVEQPLMKMQKLDWVVLGGYRGTDIRPLHPHWVRRIQYDCKRESIPFYFKGWGDFGPVATPDLEGDRSLVIISNDGSLRGRGVGSSTNYLALETQASVPDTYLTRQLNAEQMKLIDGQLCQQMPAPRRMKLTDTSDLARMLHRLSTSSEPLSGPTTSSPGSRAPQSQSQPAHDATMVAPK